MPVLRNKEKSILYIHTPKTGGAYIEDFFKANGFKMTYWTSIIDPIERCTAQHYHMKILNQLFDFSKFNFIFMTVRNPISRLVSEYNWLIKKRKILSPSISFEEFLKKTLEDYNKNPYLYDNHIRPQTEFAKKGVTVFKQENQFDEKWAERLETLIGIEFKTKEVVKTQNSPDFHKKLTLGDVDPAVVKAVNDFYHLDFKNFNYDPEEAWNSYGIHLE
ncbi:sulfotransferase family 2 domain-containing protein [Temperatibacter marinus]|uniref:Sulfotransferase family 2 domain-containing protein n=1 Tax=Temperatibacter marinus TaxID=1456591 RepID=A0AA52EHE1_9PROT|nr:sulfotransferase family 2 domain-containing protein [Temperatibacter marinus]WND03198.1 sulfotransferase family 2 domain-containing protein [Temperatibacter marinus]